MKKLFSVGYSQNQIARSLNVDPGTIARDLAVADLTEEYKDRINGGESVTAVLEAASAVVPATPSTDPNPTPGSLRADPVAHKNWYDRIHREVAESIAERRRLEKLGVNAMRPQPKDPKDQNPDPKNPKDLKEDPKDPKNSKS